MSQQVWNKVSKQYKFEFQKIAFSLGIQNLLGHHLIHNKKKKKYSRFCSRNNYNFTPSPSSDSHCDSPTSNYNLPHMSSTGEIKVGLNGRGSGGENPSPQLKHEDYPTTVSGDCGGGGRSLNFNDEQIDCICDSLQQRGDVSKLENFLQIHEADKPITAIGKGSETVMRARAFVAFERGRYRELYNIIETREFNPKYHPQLQDMWYRAHYKEAEGVRGRALGKILIFSKANLLGAHPKKTELGVFHPQFFKRLIRKQSNSYHYWK